MASKTNILSFAKGMAATMNLTAEQLFEAIADSPVIPAVKSEDGLKQCMLLDNTVVFILSSTINDIIETVARLKQAGKIVFIHIDLIDGLAARDAAVSYIAANTLADGIISTKPQVLRSAKEAGLFTIQRFFALDSISLDNIRKVCAACEADLIEILPGLMPKIISRICTDCGIPLIAGGLISDKEDAVAALGAGAVAVSTTNTTVWAM